MAGKSLPPFQVITNGDMSTASITSTISDIRNIDNVAYELTWSGTSPVGTVAVNGSLDYDPTTPTLKPGTWTSLTLSPSPAVSGNTGSILINMTGLAFPFIQVVYTKTSGTGTLQAYVSGKAV